MKRKIISIGIISLFLLSSFSFASAIDLDTNIKANDTTELLLVTVVDTHELPTNCKIRAICPNGVEYTDFTWNKTAGHYEGELPVNDDPSSSIIYNVTVTSHKVLPKYFLVPMTIGYPGFALFHIDGQSGDVTEVDFGKIIGYEKVPGFLIFEKPEFYIEKQNQNNIPTAAAGKDILVNIVAEIEPFVGPLAKIFPNLFETGIVIDVQINGEHISLFTTNPDETNYPMDFLISNQNSESGETIELTITLSAQLYYPNLRMTVEGASSPVSEIYKINII